MRIALVAYACAPGEGSEPGVGWNVATALSQEHEVWVFTRANNRRQIEDAMPSELAARLKFVYHDLPGLFRLKRLPFGLYTYHYLWQRTVGAVVSRLHDTVGFDLAHQITFGSFRYPTSLMKVENLPYVIGPVGGAEEAPLASWTTFGVSGVLRESLRWLSNRAAIVDPWLRESYRRAAAVLFASPDTQAFVESTFPLPRKSVLMPSVAVSAVSPADSGSAGSHGLRALFVGRLVHWKGATIAVDAVACARRLGADVTLTVLGDGPQRRRLEMRVRNSGMAGSVTHTPRLPTAEAVRRLYQEHDVFLFPSLHEAGGMAAVEAMAEGLPVVCVGIGGPAVSVAGGGGVAVIPGSGRQMARDMGRVLFELAADPELMAKMSGAARTTVADRYTWDAKRSQLTELYREVSRLR